MEREQTTIRLPAELKEELQREAESMLSVLSDLCHIKGFDIEDYKSLCNFLVKFDEQYCNIIAEKRPTND